MLKFISPLALTAILAVAATATPATAAYKAYSCEVKAYVNKNKMTVCADPKLKALDQSIRKDYVVALQTFGDDGRPTLHSARDAFVADRSTCDGDARCLSAVYRSQDNLLFALSKCQWENNRKGCLERNFARHREALHKSM